MSNTTNDTSATPFLSPQEVHDIVRRARSGEKVSKEEEQVFKELTHKAVDEVIEFLEEDTNSQQ